MIKFFSQNEVFKEENQPVIVVLISIIKPSRIVYHLAGNQRQRVEPRPIRSSFDPAIVNVKCCNTAHSPRYGLNVNKLRETQTVRV